VLIAANQAMASAPSLSAWPPTCSASTSRSGTVVLLVAVALVFARYAPEMYRAGRFALAEWLSAKVI
jgi:hypothetical protein